MSRPFDPVLISAVRPRQLWRPWGVAAIVLVLGLAGILAHRQALDVALQESARRGDVTLRLAVESLQSRLERFERLPQLLAENEIITRLAGAPDTPEAVELANGHLKRIGRMIGASDVYFMDRAGLTRAASNFDTETSFIGGNFAFRPYFIDALKGGEGRFYALGTTSRKRGYYFGAPVWGEAGVMGVLVIKIDLDQIEESWRGGSDAIVVTSPEGVVFLSSRSDWLFRLIEPFTPDRRARMEATRRFADAGIAPLDLMRHNAPGGQLFLEIRDSAAPGRYIKRSEPMPTADWEVWVLVETGAAEREAKVIAATVVLALALAFVVLWQVRMRRARLRENLELEARTRAELEARVTERTSELATARDLLEEEVTERRATEMQLRKAQADLVQAGKMAALGQMSAALSHEFNQPLAAARNYADNALVLMDRGRPDEARGNMDRIIGLIDRMASISRHLRSFARKPGQKLGPVSLPEVVAAAQEIAGVRLRSAGVDLKVDLPPDLPPVQGGAVRLQQVLVNLLTNAADAVDGRDDRRLHLRATLEDGAVRLYLRDHGPGFAPGVIERIFDPFFSTKGVGKGLGLGLSISYNIVKDFGGNLTARNADDGGAIFTLDLPRADLAQAA
jgi:two-component system C4-dicarboxylate transport sensor histidine kinase DctB